MKKIMFLIPNLKPGGAERVLVNLVNNLDASKYSITVQTIFDVGIHRQALKPHVRYLPGLKHQFRGNLHFFKLFSPEALYRYFVREEYDIIVSYLEGVTARIVAGCQSHKTAKLCWIHTEMNSQDMVSRCFRSFKEASDCYNRFDRVIGVSCRVSQQITEHAKLSKPAIILYNTNETEKILEKSLAGLDTETISGDEIKVCAIGRLTPVKGFDRLLLAHKRLIEEGICHRVYVLGTGEDYSQLKQLAEKNGLENSFILMGFQENPYQYLSSCDLYVCSSRREGFSTTVTEALIIGTPVVSTDCSGAKELLGENDEYGLVVENSEEGIYQGMKRMLSDPELLAHYKKKAKERGSFFSREQTVQAVEAMFDSL